VAGFFGKVISLRFITGKSPVPRPNTHRATADMPAITQKIASKFQQEVLKFELIFVNRIGRPGTWSSLCLADDSCIVGKYI